MNISKAYNFKQVNDLLSCSGTLKQVNLQSFSDEAYELVINLLPDDNEYAVENEKHDIQAMGIQYEYIPVDWNAPGQADFDVFESVLVAGPGKKTHIHCAANFRVTAFYGIYAFRNLGWSATELNTFIASIWQLSEYPVWLEFVSGFLNGSDK